MVVDRDAINDPAQPAVSPEIEEEVAQAMAEGEGQVLLVDVEKKEDGERWHGEFSASYIEEVTQKTGNFKKFSVFVKMLATSLNRDHKSDTVFADLLTYADLEMLRSRQTRKPLNAASRPNNKRYLILTYAVEFDRVHYPLPLGHVDEPPVHALTSTIRRLREEIKQLKAGGVGGGAGRSAVGALPGGSVCHSHSPRVSPAAARARLRAEG